MAKTDIWMPLYIGDYLADTIGISLAEHGAYMLSLMAYWRKKGPLSVTELSQICNNHCDRVCQFYKKEGNFYRHTRIDKELSIAQDRQEAQQQRTEAARGAKLKKRETLVTIPVIENVTIPVTASPSPSPSPSPSHTPSEELKPSCANFENFWQAYPKKKNKGDAEKAFKVIKPSEPLLEMMLIAIEKAKASVDWQKEGRKYVPYPASWLRAKGWEDEYISPPSDNWTGLAEKNYREGMNADGTF